MGVPPFIDLVAVRPISLIGTRTPACIPCTYTLREAGNGVVVKADPADMCPVPVTDPLPIVWSLMRRSFLQNVNYAQSSKIKKATPIRGGCGRETNGARLFSLPYAGITQVRF
jgi:hypothetical protein